ncbi:MAG: hypothetical protein IPH35_18620 [Rhodoferax sp.]|nr:hypothetical protein [Rhodoferax sp.]
MKHTHTVPHFLGNTQLLTQEIGDLYYDALADFLHSLAKKIEADSQADGARGRTKLANELAACSHHIEQAAQHIDTAWGICKPFVKPAHKATVL